MRNSITEFWADLRMVMSGMNDKNQCGEKNNNLIFICKSYYFHLPRGRFFSTRWITFVIYITEIIYFMVRKHNLFCKLMRSKQFFIMRITVV